MKINPSGHCFLSSVIKMQAGFSEGSHHLDHLLGRLTAVVLPVFELLQALQLTAHVFVMFTNMVIMLPFDMMEMVAKERDYVIDSALPSPLDFVKTVLKALTCYVMIVIGPLITIFNPGANAYLHAALGLCLATSSKEEQVTQKKKEEGPTENDMVSRLKKLLEDREKSLEGILLKEKGPGFARIVGMEAYKAELLADVIEPLRESLAPDAAYKLFEQELGSLEAERGLIFYGPTGCGKSEMARAIAEELGYSRVFISPAMFSSSYVNGSVKVLSKIMDELKKNLPAVLVINECETLFPNRLLMDSSKTADGESAKLVGALLDEFDQLKEKGLVVIATTNADLSKTEEKNKLDPGLLRPGRLGKQLKIPLPDASTREALLNHYAPMGKCEMQKQDLLDQLKDYTVAEIKAFGERLRRYLHKQVRAKKQAGESEESIFLFIQDLKWGKKEAKEALPPKKAKEIHTSMFS